MTVVGSVVVDLSGLAESSRMVGTWREWREATRAHSAAKRDAGFHPDAAGIDLPTFARMMRAWRAWTLAASVARGMRVGR